MAIPEMLARDIGPLPLWAWGGVGAAGAFVLLRRRGSATPPLAASGLPVDFGAPPSPGLIPPDPGAGGTGDPGAVQSWDPLALIAQLQQGGGGSVTGPGGQAVTVTPVAPPAPSESPVDIGSILASMRATLAGLVGNLAITLPGGASFAENVAGAQTPATEPPPSAPPPPPAPDPTTPPGAPPLGGFNFNLPSVYRQTSNFLNEWGFAGDALSGGRPAMEGLSAGAVLGAEAAEYEKDLELIRTSLEFVKAARSR